MTFPVPHFPALSYDYCASLLDRKDTNHIDLEKDK